MSVLLAFLLLLTAASGAGVALTREPRRQVVALAANGFVLSLLFVSLQAPDVAFAEIAVGSAATPLLFLVALASMRMKQEIKPETDDS